MAGMLYLVPTPIGNLGDISLRCRETLESADFIAAEDTRMTMKLTQRFGIKEFYHVDAYGLDFEPERTEEIMGVACDKARALARDF